MLTVLPLGQVGQELFHPFNSFGALVLCHISFELVVFKVHEGLDHEPCSRTDGESRAGFAKLQETYIPE